MNAEASAGPTGHAWPGDDELLVERFGRGSDSVGDVGEFQLAEQVEQGQTDLEPSCDVLRVRVLVGSH